MNSKEMPLIFSSTNFLNVFSIIFFRHNLRHNISKNRLSEDRIIDLLQSCLEGPLVLTLFPSFKKLFHFPSYGHIITFGVGFQETNPLDNKLNLSSNQISIIYYKLLKI